jgi:hypothetical protein
MATSKNAQIRANALGSHKVQLDINIVYQLAKMDVTYTRSSASTVDLSGIIIRYFIGFSITVSLFGCRQRAVHRLPAP